MKDLKTPEVLPLSEQEIVDIKTLIEEQWEKWETKDELTQCVVDAFKFGLGKTDFDKESPNRHYYYSDVLNLVNEVDLEKNPPIVEGIVVEEPIAPIIGG